MTDSTDFNHLIRDSDWDEFFCTPPANPDPVAPGELSLPQNISEFLSTSTLLDLERLCSRILEILQDARSTQPTQEIPPNPSPHDAPDTSSFPPQIAAPADYGTRLCPVCSASFSLPPPSQTVALPQLSTFPTFPLSPTLPPPNWRMIPQGVYGRGRRQWDFTPSESIYFGVNGSPGVNMGDALRKIFGSLDGRDDIIFQGARSAFSCRFLFPGYPPNSSHQIFTRHWNKERDPITRSWLAHLIARKLEEYLNSMAPRPYTVTESTPMQWKIGEGFMNLDKIWVVDPTIM